MPTFDESIVSVSGRLTHAWDFAFYKNNGDIANRMRAELGSSLKQLNIDSDGDINVDMVKEGSFFVTPGGIVAAGWLTDSKTLSAQQEVGKFTRIIELIAKLKGSFAIESYNIRLFFRFRPADGVSLLRTRGFEGVLRLILLDEKTPTNVESLKFSTSQNRDGFFDLIELEASPKDVQLRYSRSASGSDFDSYSAFLDAANLARLAKDLRPFAEILIAAEPRLGLRGLLSELK